MKKIPRHIDSDHRHEAFKLDVLALIQKHEPQLRQIEMLAVASKLVGMLVAAQDQRTVTPESAMKTVSINIEMGNQQFIGELLNKTDGHA